MVVQSRYLLWQRGLIFVFSVSHFSAEWQVATRQDSFSWRDHRQSERTGGLPAQTKTCHCVSNKNALKLSLKLGWASLQKSWGSADMLQGQIHPSSVHHMPNYGGGLSFMAWSRVSAAIADREGSGCGSPITGAWKDPTCHISITMNPDFNSDFCLGWLNARLLSPYASTHFLLESTKQPFHSLQMDTNGRMVTVYIYKHISCIQ